MRLAAAWTERFTSRRKGAPLCWRGIRTRVTPSSKRVTGRSLSCLCNIEQTAQTADRYIMLKCELRPFGGGVVLSGVCRHDRRRSIRRCSRCEYGGNLRHRDFRSYGTRISKPGARSSKKRRQPSNVRQIVNELQVKFQSRFYAVRAGGRFDAHGSRLLLDKEMPCHLDSTLLGSCL